MTTSMAIATAAQKKPRSKPVKLFRVRLWRNQWNSEWRNYATREYVEVTADSKITAIEQAFWKLHYPNTPQPPPPTVIQLDNGCKAFHYVAFMPQGQGYGYAILLRLVGNQKPTRKELWQTIHDRCLRPAWIKAI